MNRLTIDHLNINSLGNRFNTLKHLVKISLGSFMILEIKVNEIFPRAQIFMDGFTPPYRMDRNTNGGCIALYVTKDIPSRQILFKSDDKDVEHSEAAVQRCS